MSYDISLSIDTGGSQLVEVDEVGNYTSNVSRMWAKALGHQLSDFHDRLAGDCIEPLSNAIAEMNLHPAVYKAMNPNNGWGSYEGAVEYLADFRRSCERHPKATVVMWV